MCACALYWAGTEQQWITRIRSSSDLLCHRSQTTERKTELTFLSIQNNEIYKLECTDGLLLTHVQWKLAVMYVSLHPLYQLPYIRDSFPPFFSWQLPSILCTSEAISWRLNMQISHTKYARQGMCWRCWQQKIIPPQGNLWPAICGLASQHRPALM